jgi:hypothetical protein
MCRPESLTKLDLRFYTRVYAAKGGVLNVAMAIASTGQYNGVQLQDKTFDVKSVEVTDDSPIFDPLDAKT